VVRRRKAEGNPVRLVRQDVRPHQSGPKAALSRIGRATDVELDTAVQDTYVPFTKKIVAAYRKNWKTLGK
ncbi:hypothetical protein, partial [Bradyrhizobium liaoningense]|uniref:hypothetical protein n=1 Tax=Bradyrhizobium liaoningense TaxID=43992 RepID=UPI0024E1012A